MNLILAADRNWAIGYKGQLLCHLPGDMKFFKAKTTGKTVVMGRATLESLPHRRGLPNRRNLVLTTRQGYEAENAEIVHDEEALFRALEGTDPEDVFVIGGAKVYEELLPYCTFCYVTRIDDAFPADRYFTDLDQDPAFTLTGQSEWKEENGHRYRFLTYERR